jgi:predicted small lipoprotein YifL
MPKQKRLVRWLLASMITAVLLISGCGQKGPLYLPDENQEEEER